MKLRQTLLIFAAILALHSRPANARPVTAISTAATNQPATTGTNDIPEPKDPEQNFTNSVGMELVQVPGGFWAGKFEVTQKQFQKVMNSNPSAFSGETRPVDSITYDEAVEFCEKMTALDLKKKKLPAGYYYTLPTEDEWTSLVSDASLDDAVTSLNGAFRSDTAIVGSL